MSQMWFSLNILDIKRLSMEENFIEVQPSQLKKETLMALIESYVLREGTDYGQVEYSLEEKTHMVLKQIKNKKAWIIYDMKSEHCFISSERVI